VQGKLWGTIEVISPERLPADTEQRLANFTAPVGTAIANADTHLELAASRRRIVAASDEARRRIERDLHDGMQQRLISLALRLRAAESHVGADDDVLREEVAGVASGLATAVEPLKSGCRNRSRLPRATSSRRRWRTPPSMLLRPASRSRCSAPATAWCSPSATTAWAAPTRGAAPGWSA
jgi:Histidine kinase